MGVNIPSLPEVVFVGDLASRSLLRPTGSVGYPMALNLAYTDR